VEGVQDRRAELELGPPHHQNRSRPGLDRVRRHRSGRAAQAHGHDSYRLAEYDSWLQDAGLKRIEFPGAPMHRILLAARE